MRSWTAPSCATTTFAAAFLIEALNRIALLLTQRPLQGSPWIHHFRLFGSCSSSPPSSETTTAAAAKVIPPRGR